MVEQAIKNKDMNFIKYLMPSVVGITVLLFLFSCGGDTPIDNHDGHDHGTSDVVTDDGHDAPETAHEEGEIHLTEIQVKTVGITFGSFSKIKANDFITATGSLGLPPNAYSAVSAKAKGFIKNSKKYVEGSFVKKGAIMANLENPEFIQLQQKCLEVAAELKYLKLELARQEKLLAANAGVSKNLEKVQSEVAIKTAQLESHSKQLTYLGINAEKLTPENIVDRIHITAPMTGYITSINVHNGMYVSPEMELMEIVSEDHLHLELDVFERDIAKVKEDQRISYTVPSLGNTVYEGEVHVIGKEFNSENKTVAIHGHLDKKRPRFIKGLFINAKIWLNDQTVEALPEASVIRDEGKAYIYVSNEKVEHGELTFEKVAVISGATNEGFTTIKLIDEIPEGMQIVTNGAYYVYAESKKGEKAHDH